MWPLGDKNQCLNTPCQGTPTETEWVVSVSLGEEEEEEGVNVDKVSIALIYVHLHSQGWCCSLVTYTGANAPSRASLIEKILGGFGG